jgi:hypothetical protein
MGCSQWPRTFAAVEGYHLQPCTCTSTCTCGVRHQAAGRQQGGRFPHGPSGQLGSGVWGELGAVQGGQVCHALRPSRCRWPWLWAFAEFIHFVCVYLFSANLFSESRFGIDSCQTIGSLNLCWRSTHSSSTLHSQCSCSQGPKGSRGNGSCLLCTASNNWPVSSCIGTTPCSCSSSRRWDSSRRRT